MNEIAGVWKFFTSGTRHVGGRESRIILDLKGEIPAFPFPSQLLPSPEALYEEFRQSEAFQKLEQLRRRLGQAEQRLREHEDHLQTAEQRFLEGEEDAVLTTSADDTDARKGVELLREATRKAYAEAADAWQALATSRQQRIAEECTAAIRKAEEDMLAALSPILTQYAVTAARQQRAMQASIAPPPDLGAPPAKPFVPPQPTDECFTPAFGVVERIGSPLL